MLLPQSMQHESNNKSANTCVHAAYAQFTTRQSGSLAKARRQVLATNCLSIAPATELQTVAKYTVKVEGQFYDRVVQRVHSGATA